MRPLRLDQKVVHAWSDDLLKALLAACRGPELRDRRDEAILRLMLETGTRAGEVVALQLADVDLARGTVLVRRARAVRAARSPSARARDAPWTATCGPAVATDLSTPPALSLGNRGKEFSYHGLHATLKTRAARAGVAGFHPHLLRHTTAHRWLSAAGSEGGLMDVAGWTRPDMLLRYTRAQASQRAAAEARQLNLGEL